MATVDPKIKLKLEIGQAKHTLPLYEDYKDFYNGKYLTIKTFNKTLYVPLTLSRSEFAVNAGVIIGDEKYYFLTQALEKNGTYESVGTFYKYIKGNSNSYPLTKILSLGAIIPEDGSCEIKFKVKWAGSYNAYHDYRRNSAYRFVTKIDSKTLTDTGLTNLATYPFSNYATSRSGEDMAGVTKWMDLGTRELVLSAGRQDIDLYIEMWENNNKHAAAYVSAFQVDVNFKGVGARE